VAAAYGQDEGARPASLNNFQGRYAIRHPWTRGRFARAPPAQVWGGPPSEIAMQPGYGERAGARGRPGVAARGKVTAGAAGAAQRAEIRDRSRRVGD
jgi:hypothetical protein